MATLSTVVRHEAQALRAAAQAGRRWLAGHRKALFAVIAVLVLLLLFSAVRDVLRDVRYEDIVAAMKATTTTQLLFAALATLLSFVALTGYDYLARHRVRHYLVRHRDGRDGRVRSGLRRVRRRAAAARAERGAALGRR